MKALFIALAILLSPLSVDANEACDALPEAIVCEAAYPWKKVIDFPFAQFENEPIGYAVVFHLDGRGVGIVQHIDKNTEPYQISTRDWANLWMEKFLNTDDLTMIGEWERLSGYIDGKNAEVRKVFLDANGRTMALRGSFVSTEFGNLVVYSILNQKINSQAGSHLHRRLIKAVNLR
jgi:hypothetical protein